MSLPEIGGSTGKDHQADTEQRLNTLRALNSGSAAEQQRKAEFRILFAEDDADNRLLIPVYLKMAKFPNCISVASGDAALEEMMRNQYDLLITDFAMPGRNGLELVDAIRSLPGYGPTFPVIILTANTIEGKTIDTSKAQLKIPDNVHVIPKMGLDRMELLLLVNTFVK